MRIVVGSLLLLCLVLFSSAYGQDATPPAADDQRVCNEDFARTLVEQQATESRSVEATDKRVRMLIRSADFLWKYNEPKARDYFTEAFKVARERFAENGFEKKRDGDTIRFLPDYRFEVIKGIAKRDAAWAKKLTEELLKEYEKADADRDPMDKNREIDSVMGIARDNVKTNPALSWFLFRRLMQAKVEHQWFWTLYGVAMEDPAFADALYKELLVSQANVSPWRLLFLSAYPFARPRIFGYDSEGYGASMPDGFAPRPALQRQFIDAFLRRSDAFASDPANLNTVGENYRPNEAVYIVTTLNELEPEIVQNFPTFIPRLASVRAKAYGMLSEENRKSMTDRDKSKRSMNSSFEQRMDELEKADEEGKLKDSMIVQALLTPPKTDEQFRTLETWVDKITSDPGRGQTANYFWFQRAKLAIKDDRLDDARRFAAKVPELQHAAMLQFNIAEKQLANLNDASSAYQTLADVSKLTRQAPDTVGKARVHLGLAKLYEKMNHSFAVSELSDAVGVVNKLEDEDLMSGYVTMKIEVKDFSFFASFGVPGYGLEESFTALSKEDFSLPLSNARALSDKFYRTIAVIAVAKNCVDRPKPKVALN
jgi:hypothetical protein